MEEFMKLSEKGSASLYLIYITPVLMAAVFVLYFVFSFSDTNLELTNTCLKEQLKIQEQVKKSLHSLFALNPKAESLRMQYRKAKLQLIAAQASGNSAAAAAARLKMSILWQKRCLLDLQQKSLIQAVNSYLHSSQIRLLRKMSSLSSEKEIQFSFLANLSVKHLKFKTVTLAVTPDSKEPAPVYSFSENFLEEQALEMTWNLKFESHGISANFLTSSADYPQSCSTTINNQEDTWPTVTRRVKSSWKRSS
jgi:hypothetical protein